MTDQTNKASAAHNALVLITQFCAEYVNALADRPATQMSVKVQMDAALREIERALPIPEVAQNGSAVAQAIQRDDPATQRP